MKSRVLLSAGVLSALGVATATPAQNAPAPTFELEEVVVTAEKREENLQKTSIAIDVKEGEDLRRDGLVRVDDILRDTAGVQVELSGGAGQVGVTIRGITSFNGDPPGAGLPGASIPILIDTMAQDRGQEIRGGTLDLARVEIMRGPQSVNVGANAMAGAVSLVTNDPVLTSFQGEGRLEMGSYHLYSTEGVINAPIGESQALRLAVSSEKRNGYLSSGAGESDLSNARLKYRLQVSDSLNVVVAAAHNALGGNNVGGNALLPSGRWLPISNVSGSPTYVPMNGCVPVNATDRVSSGCRPAYVVRQDGTNYRTRPDPWDDGLPLDDTGTPRINKTTVDQFYGVVTKTLSIGTLVFEPSYQLSSTRGTAEVGSDQRTPQLDVHLASLAGSRLEWLGGVYYKYTTRDTTYRFETLPGAPGCPATAGASCFGWAYIPYARQTTEAAYANFKYSIADTLRVIGGLRYNHDAKETKTDDKGVTGAVRTPGSPLGPFGPYTFVEHSHTWSATDYRAGVEYDFAANSMAYATASTGYRPGQQSFNANTRQWTDTQAFKLTQYTLGVKSRFLDNRLQVNAEVFDATLKNNPVNGGLSATLPGSAFSPTAAGPAGNCSNTGALPVPELQPGLGVSPDATCVNVGNGNATADQKTRGIEFSLNYLLTDADRIDLSVNGQQAKYQGAPSLNNSGVAITAQSMLDAIATASASGLYFCQQSQPTTCPVISPTQLQANAAALAAALNANVAILNGAQLPNAPRWSANATYQHTFKFTNGSSLTPRINAVYKTSYYSGTNGIAQVLGGQVPLAFQDAVTQYNLYATLDLPDSKLAFTAYVSNLSNEVIMENYSDTGLTLDAPRTYGITLQGRF